MIDPFLSLVCQSWKKKYFALFYFHNFTHNELTFFSSKYLSGHKAVKFFLPISQSVISQPCFWEPVEMSIPHN